jgi:hypothetical protein
MKPWQGIPDKLETERDGTPQFGHSGGTDFTD